MAYFNGFGWIDDDSTTSTSDNNLINLSAGNQIVLSPSPITSAGSVSVKDFKTNDLGGVFIGECSNNGNADLYDSVGIGSGVPFADNQCFISNSTYQFIGSVIDYVGDTTRMDLLSGANQTEPAIVSVPQLELNKNQLVQKTTGLKFLCVDDANSVVGWANPPASPLADVLLAGNGTGGTNIIGSPFDDNRGYGLLDLDTVAGLELSVQTSPTGYSGDLNLKVNNSLTGNGGNINISTGSSVATSGSINLETGSGTTDGNINLLTHGYFKNGDSTHEPSVCVSSPAGSAYTIGAETALPNNTRVCGAFEIGKAEVGGPKVVGLYFNEPYTEGVLIVHLTLGDWTDITAHAKLSNCCVAASTLSTVEIRNYDTEYSGWVYYHITNLI